mmetsp:Transcript_26051/g.41260  ORF Transcript_26051/g.41260 Transcript_26051/m.41260 type:complete len:140 (-) Transcript_26051:73-492(-)
MGGGVSVRGVDPAIREFEALMDQFDKILDRCDSETVEYTKCINAKGCGDVAGLFSRNFRPGKTSKTYSGPCGAKAYELSACFERREDRYALVRTNCGKLNEDYEICMMQNSKNPSECAQSVRKLLECTQNALNYLNSKK